MPAPAPPAARVLVVDDDEGLLILMADALRGEGCTVATAGSARAALAWLGAHPADLLLLDLKLGDGSGPELVDRLQAAAPGLPFIVVTGQGDEQAAVGVMKRGALDYVRKDTTLLDLLPGVVKRALDGLARERALAAAQRERERLEGEVLAASERERQSIGADLHDGLGQQLTAMELMCAGLRADSRASAPALTPGLDRLGQMLREAIAQTRFLARGLVPLGHEPDALQVGLAELAARTNALGQTACTFTCPAPVILPDRIVTGHLYRIAQEAINNALKHAAATRIAVRLERRPGHLVLEVADNGGGLGAGRDGQGVGLGLMRHRAALVGARVDVVSRRGRGVTVSCRLPISA